MQSVQICDFFLQNGYCTLGDQCKLYHARSEKDVSSYNKVINEGAETKEDEKKEEEPSPEKQYADITEICFSFDTTGSMDQYLEEVRQSLQEIVKDLFAKVPNIRISIIAHGDYCDKDMYYVIKYIDFTRDIDKLLKFVRKDAGPTGGGDEPECYELALWYAAHKLKWTKNAKSKALVIIGDAPPHEPDYHLNDKNIDWRKETDLLRMQEVTIYGVFCGGQWCQENKPFYKSIAKKTNGRCLELTNIKHICKLFVALCLRTSDDNALFEQYKNEILRSSAGDDELSKAIMSLSGMQRDAKSKRIKVDSAIKRLMYDLKEIKREKLIDIAVVPEEDNVFKWHVNIKPMQGVFKNVYVHLTLEFPSNYPSSPPQIKLVTKIPDNIHPNIERNIVCLPLFGADNYNGSKSKYGSSWSAAYSIISLLVNVSSIFSEIEVVHKKSWNDSKHTMSKSAANKLLGSIRKTGCFQCGHSHNTPYPVLGSNKLPFDMNEINVNEQHYKKILQDVIKDKNKKKQERIIKRERKDRMRGALIAGNIIETVKANKFWKIKSQQGINRNYHETVSWQFSIDMFDRKKSSTLYSDYIFGFVNEEDIFFGVGLDGNVVFDNNNKYNQLYHNDNEKRKVKQHSIMTYILHLNNSNVKESRDQLCIFINYNLIATVSVPTLYIKCDIFYPVMYVKDIRLHLNLDIDPKLNHVINTETFPFHNVEPFNKLQSSYIINTKDSINETNQYYTDQTMWDELIEKALSTDILLDIFTYLSYSDMIHCKEVNTFWYSVLNGHNVIDRMEMRCFYTHESIEKKKNKCVLGVGLNVTRSSNKWISSVETEMDFLSLSAYKDYNIYQGAWGETITHFLPLVINEKHAKTAKKAILNRIAKICDEKTFDVKDALMVVTAIMNQFVVQLMANTIGLNNDDKQSMSTNQRKIDPKHASEKALVGYCAFHHMLLYLANEYPKMKEYARESIKNFIDDPYFREKSETKDLGKFLLNLAIVEEYKWEDVANAFIHESMDRRVKWSLQKFPKLEYLDEAHCSHKERIALTLKSSMISRRLVTFQVFFLKNICKQDGYSLSDLLNNYNKRWGRPTNQQKNMLVKAAKDILLKDDNLNSWLEYFHFLGINKYKTNLQVCNALKKAVINSKNKSYHRANDRKMKTRNKRKRAPRYERMYSPAAPADDFELEQAKLDVTDTEVIEMQGELEGHSDWITCIKVDINNPDRIITGSRDKSIIIWDLKATKTKRTGPYAEIKSVVEGKMVRRIKGHNHFISDIDISADGNYIISASWDGLLKLWNGKTGKKVTTFSGHKKDVLGVRFSADNRRILSCARDRNMNIWNTVGEIKHAINGAHRGWITCVAFSPDVEREEVFVSGSVDKMVNVWQFDNSSSNGYILKHRLIGHNAGICCITISPDGSLCASGDKCGVVYLWDIESGKCLSSLNAATGNHEITSIVFSPNRYWACFSIGNSIEIWDLETKTNVGILKDAQSLADVSKRKHYSTLNLCTCIVWSADGKRLYAGYSNHKIRVWTLISPFDGLSGSVKKPVKFDLNAEYEYKPTSSPVYDDAATEEIKEATPDLVSVPAIRGLRFEMKTSTSFMSALCIIPPDYLWTDIQDIRRLYDPAYHRWMPHINIFFPFINESYFAEIAEYIQLNIVQKYNIKSFDISLNEFCVFDRIKRRLGSDSLSDQMETLFLSPSGCSRELQNIFNHLRGDWPICANKHGGKFNPHLTVGKFKQREIGNWMNQFQSSWKSKTFKCNALYLISRRGDNKPFEIRYKIPLC